MTDNTGRTWLYPSDDGYDEAMAYEEQDRRHRLMNDIEIDIDDIGLFRSGHPSQYDKARDVCDHFCDCMARAIRENDCALPGQCAASDDRLDCAHLTVEFFPRGEGMAMHASTAEYSDLVIPFTRRAAAQLESRMRVLGARVAVDIGTGSQAQLETVEREAELRDAEARSFRSTGSVDDASTPDDDASTPPYADPLGYQLRQVQQAIATHPASGGFWRSLFGGK